MYQKKFLILYKKKGIKKIIIIIIFYFRDEWLLQKMTTTFITLTLKKQGTCNFNHFPFLRLYNVCYKIIAKIKVQGLKPLLGKLIDPTQLTFVPN